LHAKLRNRTCQGLDRPGQDKDQAYKDQDKTCKDKDLNLVLKECLRINITGFNTNNIR